MKKLVFLLAVCSGMSCSSPNKIPDDVMDINTMKLIVWDMQRASVLAQNQFRIKTDTLVKGTLINFEKVLAVHKVSREAFYKSYDYYLEHPDKNKILMDSIIAYANRKRADFFKSMQ